MSDVSFKDILKEYSNYLRSEEATVVYLAKYVAEELDTKNKWINVVDYDNWGYKINLDKNGNEIEKLAFNYIIVELYQRKINPKYPEDADRRLKRAITWKASHEDISAQRSQGIRGPMFLITCQLYNINRGKKKTVKYDNWNEEFGGFDLTGKYPTTTITRKVDIEPEWDYRITGIRPTDDEKNEMIRKNYSFINSRITDERRVNIDWFFDEDLPISLNNKRNPKSRF